MAENKIDRISELCFLAHHKEPGVRKDAALKLCTELNDTQNHDSVLAIYRTLSGFHKDSAEREIADGIPTDHLVATTIRKLSNTGQSNLVYYANSVYEFTKRPELPELGKELGFKTTLQMIERYASIDHFWLLIEIAKDKEIPKKWRDEASSLLRRVGFKAVESKLESDDFFHSDYRIFVSTINSPVLPEGLGIDLGNKKVRLLTEDGDYWGLLLLLKHGPPKEVELNAKNSLEAACLKRIEECSKGRVEDYTLKQILKNQDLPETARITAGRNLIAYYIQEADEEELAKISASEGLPEVVRQEARAGCQKASDLKIEQLVERSRFNDLVEMFENMTLPESTRMRAIDRAIKTANVDDSNERRDLTELLDNVHIPKNVRVGAGLRLIEFFAKGETDSDCFSRYLQFLEKKNLPKEVREKAEAIFKTTCLKVVENATADGEPHYLLYIAKDRENRFPEAVRKKAAENVVQAGLKAVAYYEREKLNWRLTELIEPDMPEQVRDAAKKALSEIARKIAQKKALTNPLAKDGTMADAKQFTRNGGGGGTIGPNNTKRLLLR